MKEADTLSEFNAPAHKSELTGEAKSTYARRGMTRSNMATDRIPDPIDTPLDGGLPAGFEEQLQAMYAVREGAVGPMTDEEKDEIRTMLLTPKAERATLTTVDQQPKAPRKADEGEDANLEKDYQKAMLEANRQIKHMNDLVHGIEQMSPDYGHDGRFPIVDAEGNISDANFVRWVLGRMMFYEGEKGPDEPINYEQLVTIKHGSHYVSMGAILLNDELYLTDEKKVKHQALAEKLRQLIFSRGTIRSRDISYRRDGKGMGDDSGIAGTIANNLKNSSMTRSELWNGKSLWYWTMEAPLELRGGNPNEREKNPDGTDNPDYDPLWRIKNQDTRLGRATATSLMTYYHINDYQKLKEMLGENSSIFTRQGFLQARAELAGDVKRVTPHKTLEQIEESYISEETLTKIFGNGNTVINPGELTKFLNFFPSAKVDTYQRALVRRLIANAVGHKYRIYTNAATKEVDTDMTKWAESQAFLMTRWTGVAARNDWGATAYDAQAKVLHLQTYREKQADESRGGAFGNMYNVGMFKALGLNYLDSMITSAQMPKDPKDPERKQYYVLREVLEQIATAPVAGDDTNPEQVVQERLKAQEVLGNLTFNDNAEQDMANNGMNRWFGEFESFIGGKELHLQKTVEWAKLRGVVYDPAQFGELIQEGFLKPLRYGYSTFEIQYDKTVRDLVDFDPRNPLHEEFKDQMVTVNGKKKIFQDMSVAEMMYGGQLLDRHDFWEGMPGEDAMLDAEKDPSEKKRLKSERKTYEHVIDPSRIATKEGRTQMFKQMALGRIAADIYSHRDFFNSPYALWDAATVEALIKALERIPGGLLVDENDLTNTMVPEYFFTNADIKWLRGLAHVTYGEIARKEGALGVAKATGKTAWAFAKAMWKGVK